MTDNITLGVFRRLDNRFEGLSDDSPRALELHNRRRDALHAVLDGSPGLRVTNWGDTDDSRPHEYVEIVLSLAAHAVFEYAIVPGLKWLSHKLAEKAVDTAAGELAKMVIAKLRPKQETKQVLNFSITLPDGTVIDVDPPDRYATIGITFPDGSRQSIEYLRPVDDNSR
jgi:hypothetical protein